MARVDHDAADSPMTVGVQVILASRFRDSLRLRSGLLSFTTWTFNKVTVTQIDYDPDPWEDLESRTPNMAPYTTIG